FEYDISKYANYGDGDAGKNTLAVRVDATRFEGWFYEGAGIYRHVWLNKLDPVHVAHWGTSVTSAPSDTEPKNAIVTVHVDIQNDAGDTRNVLVTSEIMDADGKSALASTADAASSIEGGSYKTLVQPCKLDGPHWWSPETPYLYTLVTTLKG